MKVPLKTNPQTRIWIMMMKEINYKKKNWFEDPTWSPEKIDSDYEQIKDEYDSEKMHDNPR